MTQKLYETVKAIVEDMWSLEDGTCTGNIRVLIRRLENSVTEYEQNGGWRPISEYDYKTCPMVRLAAWVVPSEEFARNGLKPYWSMGDGSFYIWGFSGVTGGNPSHFQHLPAPPTEKENV